MTMREYEERFRSPPPSLHQIFVGIRGPNHSRQRIRAVAALVGGLIAFSTGYKSGPIPTTNAEWDDIVDLAVESGDEHAIKLTEACRRLEALHPSPVFRAAADDWVRRFVETRAWSPQQLVEVGIRVHLPDA